MSKKKAKLIIGKEEYDLNVHKPSLGIDEVDVTGLAGQGGFIDPGFKSTASCESKITFIDGIKGQLLYRGYPMGTWLINPTLWKFAIYYCTGSYLINHKKIVLFHK